MRISPLAGRRKLAALYIVGAHQIGWGAATIFDHLIHDPGDAVLHELIPPLWRGGAWLLAGLLIIALARTRFERLAWIIAMLMPVQRVVSHAWSLAMVLVPGEPPGAPDAPGYIVAWSSLAALIYVIAGWPEHVVERRYGGDQ